MLRGCISLLIATLTALTVSSAPARAQNVEEEALKAVFLVRFGSFVEWPPAAFDASDAPFNICTSGSSGMAAALQRLARSERVGERPISVRGLETLDSVRQCHILYTGGLNRRDVADYLRYARGAAILTVTDERNSSERGAIHFVIVDERVRFHIDRGEAESNRLSMNSRLLNIALSVRSRRPW